ncbi:NADH-quinone oxidoreductase subunit NuoE [Alphaproteobacteria bacterium LSUCC0684]
MSISSRIAEDQPEKFAFTAENKARIKTILAKYPKDRKASAVLPLLDLAQRQHDNWVPMKAIEEIANILDMAEIRVLEVATFYTMFNLRPVGKYFIQACGTTPCWLRGSDDVMRCIKDKVGISNGETSPDGKFTLLEVECLGACVNAPMVQINDDYYEDLDYEGMAVLLDRLKQDDVPPAGSIKGRQGSQPAPGPTSLSSVTPISGKTRKAVKSARKGG